MKHIVLVGLALLIATPAYSQVVRVGVHAVGVDHSEINDARRVVGGGVGGLLSVRIGRFGLDVSGHMASLDSADGGGDAFKVLQGDVRLNVLLARGFAIEVGGGRRAIDPDFAATEVGLGRVGILSELPISSAGGFWGRAAYLVAPQFDGGGDAGLAFEVGFGAGFGTRNGRFRVRVEYEFQRIDRKVNLSEVPIQVSVGKLGLDVGF
ncbi:MAG: hypothetical protein OER90_15690 [Gemmatimonadota bacterium]|nr:hypothetical protein [Gemmatimonadota bacterium]